MRYHAHDMPSPVFISGVRKNASLDELERIIERTFLESTDQLSWLKPGDLVLLKPAINSPDPYPSTTHPLSISVIAEILRQRGARVVIGDQSGVEHVVHGPSGIMKGSTKTCFEHAHPAHSDFVSFEEGGWDQGFDHFASERTTSWKQGFFVTNWIQKADHIINLPRVSAHAQAGVTLGFKNWVGILREDNRLEFHANGPFNSFITNAAKDSGIAWQDDGMHAFIEKIVEISLAVKDKLRLTLFTGTQAQTTIGPDHQVLPFLSSYIVTPETGLVFASADPVAAETFAIAYLTELYESQTPFLQKLLQKILVLANGQIKELGINRMSDHPFVKHAVALGLGNADIAPIYTDVPEEMRKAIEKRL